MLLFLYYYYYYLLLLFIILLLLFIIIIYYYYVLLLSSVSMFLLACSNSRTPNIIIFLLADHQITFAVNTILVEISTNAFFSVMFGLAFIFMGSIIFWQTVSYHFDGLVFFGSDVFVLCVLCVCIVYCELYIIGFVYCEL